MRFTLHRNGHNMYFSCTATSTAGAEAGGGSSSVICAAWHPKLARLTLHASCHLMTA